MVQVETQSILDALRTVNDPDLHRDLVTLGMIEDAKVEDGRVSFTLVLTTAACPLKAEIEDQARTAVLGVPGVGAGGGPPPPPRGTPQGTPPPSHARPGGGPLRAWPT